MDRFLDVCTDRQMELIAEQLLFRNLSRDELTEFLRFSNPGMLHLTAGDSIHSDSLEVGKHIGLVFTGVAKVFHIDRSGYQSLIRTVRAGETFGTIVSMMKIDKNVYDFLAEVDTDILLLRPEPLFDTYPPLASVQHRILGNILASQAELFREHTWRLDILSQRSLRAKILRMLEYARKRHDSDEFDLIFSRDDMASYLAVDRASLSRSLGELKREGIIDFRKNHFVILEPSLVRSDSE